MKHLASSSIALLKRKNWARAFFIIFLAISILWQIDAMFVQPAMFSDMPETTQNEGLEDLECMTNIILA